MKRNNLIGVILPAYNEASVIEQVLSRIPRVITINSEEYKIKIIVVNDGSKDDTAAVVGKADDVTLINHIINSGAGAATRTGLHYAVNIGCSHAATMDSDGQHSVEDLKKLLNALVQNKADFIIGSRLKSAAGNMPMSKKIGNIGLSIITFLLLGVYVSDTQSGLKVLNRKALTSVDFHSDDYAFCSEMIWKARQANLRIEELPIEAIYTDYSVSRGQKNITGALDITKQLIKRRFLHFINE
jgi:glycosyltransferase involved in cell wall biosynthesis